MNHRERVLTALRHAEPDRIPIDLGSTGDSNILAQPYVALRQYLGLGSGTLRLCNVMSQCVFVEEDVRRSIGVDATGVYFQPREWRAAPLKDGSTALVPALWTPQAREDGSEVRVNASGIVTHRRPADGYYFDNVHSALANITTVQELEQYRDQIENYDRPSYLDQSFKELEPLAKDMYENTDYAIVGYFGGHIFAAALQLRGWENFMLDLITESPIAEALLDMLAEAHIRHMQSFADTVGKYVHVVHVEDDLGMQDRPLVSPALYRKMVKPYHQKLYSHIRKSCNAHLMLHSDGSIYALIPDLIEIGVDILNPVQYSAKDMDTKRLKQEFGSQISFWGGGCDTQEILPNSTPAQVEDEVKRRIDDLAPGGGFVFCQVHNVQPHVLPENLIAMYDAVHKYGNY